MNLGSGSKYLCNTCIYYFYMLTKFWRICECSISVAATMVFQQACWTFGIRPLHWRSGIIDWFLEKVTQYSSFIMKDRYKAEQ